MRTCYFFYNSDFYRYRDLDGAYLVVADRTSATVRLCLNPFSAQWQTLRDSPFANKLATGLIDPLGQEAAGSAMVVDTEIDRKDKEAILNYLRAKHGIPRLLNMDMNMASAVVVSPRER